MTPVEQFGRNLFLARRRAWLSQEQLAARAGLHRTEIGLLERGKREPRLITILKLLDALEAQPQQLLRGLHGETRRATP